MLTPLNTSHNRKLHLLDASGKIVAIKNGEVYFYMVVKGEMKYFKSEENFFHKNFSHEGQIALKEFSEQEFSELKKKCKMYI